jgi:hypothetical protein
VRGGQEAEEVRAVEIRSEWAFEFSFNIRPRTIFLLLNNLFSILLRCYFIL